MPILIRTFNISEDLINLIRYTALDIPPYNVNH